MFDKTKRQSLKNIGLVTSIPVFASFGFSARAASINKHGWAVGGTSLITEAFPDDSIFDTNKACLIEMTQPRILGPCYFTVDAKNDISEGLTGLPMMLSLKLINKNCEPLANNEIEVWHCDNEGVYSAGTDGSADSSRFSSWQCAGSDRAARKSKWYRGSQVTDDKGRVNFKTCFPGWYSGRTIHIHVRVKNKDGVSVISQFCFDEALTTEISTTHSKYVERGLQDTPLARDRFFRTNTESALFSTKKNNDGSLLAYKTLQIN